MTFLDAVDEDDPIYGACDGCGRNGYELDRCLDCLALLCPFCDHDDCPGRED